MTPKEQEFLTRLRVTFRQEASEYLQAMGEELLTLEKATPADRRPEAYEPIFRTAHSLKGAARAVGAKEIETLCHPLESVFAAGKQGCWNPDPAAFDALHGALDLLNRVLAATGPEHAGAMAEQVAAGMRRLETLAAEAKTVRSSAPVGPARDPAPPPPLPVPAPARAFPSTPAASPRAGESTAPAAATIRIPVEKLDLVRHHTEELLTLKQTAHHLTSELLEMMDRYAQWDRRRDQLRRAQRTLQQLQRDHADATTAQAHPTLAATRELLEFLEWESRHLRTLGNQINALHLTTRRDSHTAAKLVDGVLDATKQLLLLPFGTITDALPLMVRQLGRDQGKPAELILRGLEVALEKRILDEMKNPLVHLVRNAIDHGIESAPDRARAGKPPVATLTLSVKLMEGGKVEITLADDGGGIDAARVKQAAINRGIISADEAATIDHSRALALIFHSEVTTSPIVTDLSGRGLGLAIVREKAENLGGEVQVETVHGQGTRFRLVLPMTLSAFRGLVIRVSGHPFVVALSAIERVALIRPAEISTVGNRATLSLGGQALPVVFLAKVLELPDEQPRQPAPTTRPVVVLGPPDARVAFLVDEVIRDEEVRFEALAAPLVRVRNIAGATILASGELVPVLNANDLLRSALRATAGPRLARRTETDRQTATAKSILVADDSITSRTLLKHILESAGFKVTTTVNGLEALEALRSNSFDLVLSDVQMPRLSGLDLTARIRADQRLAHLPVVLITALASPEDRARGVDVGANAYLVKSDFDETSLLEIVRRLA